MAVTLQKGQKISLDKEAGSVLTKIVMGLGWDPVKKKGLFGFGGGQVEVDLDASCVLFGEQNQVLDTVWFRQLKSQDGSITHTGDNRSGAGDGDDEQIVVELARVPAGVKCLVFVVNSFTGQSFSQIDNATCRLLDGRNQNEVARYNLSCQGTHTAQIMAKVYRNGAEWKMHAIGENCSGRTFQDLIPHMLPYL
jgi:tellurium resistance protein TerZ